MTVGQRIAQRRRELGLSQEALGERLGVSRQAIYKWESDAALPEIEKLVNLSREFSVSIDWLLGQEDEGREPQELTPEQLRMVEEIVARYLAAQPAQRTIILRETVEPELPEEEPEEEPKPPKKRRRWPWVLAGLALAGMSFNLFSRLDRLNQEYQDLQSAISYVRDDVNRQIYGIANRVEEVLQSQNRLTAEQGAEVAATDCRANTVTIAARALPRTYVEGMTAEFLLVSRGQTVTAPGVLGDDHAFTADITGPLSDDITVSVVLLTEDQRETQLIGQFSYLYSASIPYVDIGNGLWGWGNKVEEYAWIDPEQSYSIGGSPAAIKDIRLGLFRDQKLLAWYEAVEKPANYVGDHFERCRFFRLEGGWTLEPDYVYCLAAVVVDEYGREFVLADTAVQYDPEQNLAGVYTDDNGRSIPSSIDPADWEY